MLYAKILFLNISEWFSFTVERNKSFPCLYYLGAPWGFEAPSVAGAELC